MPYRYLLWALLLLLVARSVLRLLRGIREGAGTRPPRQRGSPGKGELMVRDPVCGTFVVPSRAVTARDKSGTHFFCSEKCRQAYLP